MECIILNYGKTVCRRNWLSAGTNASFYKLYYYGKSIYTCQDKQIEFVPGYLYIIQENSPYRIVTEPKGFFDVLWFHVDYFMPLTNTLFQFDIKKDSIEYHLLKALQAAVYDNKKSVHDIVGVFSDIVIYEKNLIKSYDSTIVSSVAFINESFKTNVTNEAIAAHFGYNKNYFIAKFKDALGVTPHKYLIKVKMTHAKKYLLALKSVAQTSELVGYENPNTFSRDFKKYFGYSPTDFLRSSEDYI